MNYTNDSMFLHKELHLSDDEKELFNKYRSCKRII